MTIFIVLRVQDPLRMKAAIERTFPNDHLYLGHDEWLISSSGTAKTISDEIGITADPSKTGSAIVFSMQSYFGRAPSDIWDWIKTKAEANNG